MRHEIVATVRDWTFYEVTNHGFTGEFTDKPLYGFATGEVKTPKGRPELGELYGSLDHALVAAVGEKYTGPRGAGGTGVGTAADWFMRMIGADQLVPIERPADELAQAWEDSEGFPAVGPRVFARRVVDALKVKGYTLARVNDGR